MQRFFEQRHISNNRARKYLSRRLTVPHMTDGSLCYITSLLDRYDIQTEGFTRRWMMAGYYGRQHYMNGFPKDKRALAEEHLQLEVQCASIHLSGSIEYKFISQIISPFAKMVSEFTKDKKYPYVSLIG